MKKSKAKIVIKSDIDEYIKKANRSSGKNMNQKKEGISFKEGNQRMYDSFYDKKPR